MAIELTHLATLYHDDVIDEADHRRGVPSVNARWGNNVAILTGDFLFARASEIASDLGTEVVQAPRPHHRHPLRRRDPGDPGWRPRRPDRRGVHGDHPAQDRRPDRHVLPAGRAAVRRRRPRSWSGSTTSAWPWGWPSSSPTTSWTSPPPRWSCRRSRARTCGRASTPSRSCTPCRRGTTPRSSAACWRTARPQGERWGRALDIIRLDGSLAHARQAVTREVRRAVALAEGLHRGGPRTPWSTSPSSWPTLRGRGLSGRPLDRPAVLPLLESGRLENPFTSSGDLRPGADLLRVLRERPRRSCYRGGRTGRRGLQRGPGHRPPPPDLREVHHLRMRHRPGGGGLVPDPDPLLHLRLPVRDLRRGDASSCSPGPASSRTSGCRPSSR